MICFATTTLLRNRKVESLEGVLYILLLDPKLGRSGKTRTCLHVLIIIWGLKDIHTVKLV